MLLNVEEAETDEEAVGGQQVTPNTPSNEKKLNCYYLFTIFFNRSIK
jgi:hypothetical protein